MPETYNKTLTVSAVINLNTDKVWELWTDPWHIIHWYNASADWHTARAENDLRKYGRFLFRMEARDGSFGFDLSGEYREVKKNETIGCVLDDSRKVTVEFISNKNETRIIETFEPEHTHSLDMQRDGWQAIMNNFKKYAEESSKFKLMQYKIQIASTPEKVFKTMFDSISYKNWSSVFNPASRYEGSWEKGSRILFLGQDASGSVGGMISWIKDNVHSKSLKLEHIGVIKNGKEIMKGPDSDQWKGSIESYSFKSFNNKTLLSVEMDSTKEFESYLDKAWPEALTKLKSICEK